MARSSDIAGVLLAGGLSRRMGGGDKALLPLAGKPLIEHAAARLAPQVSALVVNANGDAARFGHLPFAVVADEIAGFPGPLAGILAALRWFAKNAPATRAVVSLSVDAPFAPRDLVSRLDAALPTDEASPVAVAESRGRRHPVIALWGMNAADEIAASLSRGERKVEDMIDRLGAASVAFADLEISGRKIDPFFNINTPDDLAFAENIMIANVEQEKAP